MDCAERLISSYFSVHPKEQIAITMNVKNEFPVNMNCSSGYAINYWMRKTKYMSFEFLKLQTLVNHYC